MTIYHDEYSNIDYTGYTCPCCGRPYPHILLQWKQAYTLSDFRKDFPDYKACLDWLMAYHYPNGITCKNCSKVTKHHFIEARRSYSCQECGHHVHPTAGTIFYKSSTPLTTWFYVVYRMAETHNLVSAKQIERETGVTYKTAWRMVALIKERLVKAEDS